MSLLKFFYTLEQERSSGPFGDKRGEALKNQRIKKEHYAENNFLFATTYYVRDVAGQVMAVYNDASGILNLVEQPIYGAGRIGIVYNGANDAKTHVYELADHLGNVRALFTKNNSDVTLEGYTDYYPGGMVMPNRNMIDTNGYRYGYQGEFAETDPETGKPAFELRLYDPRINRWLTTDSYGQFASPYLAMGNDWPNSIDSDGGWRSRRRAERMRQRAIDNGLEVGELTKVGKDWGFYNFENDGYSMTGINPVNQSLAGVTGNFIQSKAFLRNMNFPATVTAYKPIFFGNIEDNLNNSNSASSFVGSIAYNMVDDVYVFGTGFSLLSPDGPKHLNGNLITRGSSEGIDTGINGMLTLATLGRVKKPTMNMGQFNAKFKGVLTKTITSSKIKGVILKTMNRINKYWGKQVVAPNIKTAKSVSEGANGLINDN